jgi:glycosyltransferase involved in cell wall biosynthesis
MHFFGISVIICTYNGSKRIQFTLEALAKQITDTDINYEIIVVDNASTDNTVQLVNDYWIKTDSPIPLRIISEPEPGKANALITGFNEASYELMLVCDDDNWLQPEYLKTVLEIYNSNPDIGLLGGYGQAYFNPGEKPEWFEKWQNCYVCGKHHKKNGLLDNKDFSIWGAGSVLRKTMWNHLYNNGFRFHNSISKGKAMSEDAELSMLITFTGHSLYFDERLYFTHDLSGGRINWKNLLTQQALNGKTNAILYIYQLVYDHNIKKNLNYYLQFSKKILGLSRHLIKSSLKPKNQPRSMFFYHILKELIINTGNYKKTAFTSADWIKRIKNSHPLSNK